MTGTSQQVGGLAEHVDKSVDELTRIVVIGETIVEL